MAEYYNGKYYPTTGSGGNIINANAPYVSPANEQGSGNKTWFKSQGGGITGGGTYSDKAAFDAANKAPDYKVGYGSGMGAADEQGKSLPTNYNLDNKLYGGGTIDSTSARVTDGSLASDISNVQQTVQQEREQNLAYQQQYMEKLQAQYDQKQSDLQTQQREQAKTAAIAQYNTGEAGTPMAADADLKQNIQFQQQINDLQNQKETALMTAQKAYQDKDFEMAKYQLDTINDLSYKQQQLQQNASKEEWTRMYQMATANTRQQTADTKTADALVKMSAPELLNYYKSGNTQALQDFADKNGLSMEQVMGGLLGYQATRQDKDYLNVQYKAGILSKTKAGGEVTLPDGTKAKVLGKDSKTVSYNGEVYYNVGGVLTDTGIKDPVNLVKLMTLMASAGFDASQLVDMANKAGADITPPDTGGNTVTAPDGTTIDLHTYNSNEGYGEAVQGYITDMDKFTSAADIDKYIKGISPDSNITGDMIIKAANKYQLPWEVMTAVLQHEMGGFTSNVLKANNNPGGVTWREGLPYSNISKGSARPDKEGGNYVKFATFQDGLNAVASSISSSNKKGAGAANTTDNIPTKANGASDIEINKALTSGKDIVAKGGVKYSQGELYNAAIMDMLGAPSGVLGGMGAAAGRALMGAKENDIMKAYGLSAIDVAAAKSEFKALTAANVEIVNQATFVKTYTATAHDNLDLVTKYADDYYRSGVPFVNRAKQLINRNVGDTEFNQQLKNLSKFEVALYTATREYAKVTSGGATSAQGLTDSAMQEAEKLLDAATTPEGLKGSIEAMQADMQNVNNEFDNTTSNFAPSVSKLLGIGGGDTGGNTDQYTTGTVYSVGGKNYKYKGNGQWDPQ